MPFFLEVRSGPQAGNRIRLELGRILRVGRTDRADVAFTEDSQHSWIRSTWNATDPRLPLVKK